MIKSYKEFLNENVKENIWYHGTQKSDVVFDKFKLKKGTFLDPNYISPIFITSDYEFAKAYSGEYKTSYIYTVEVLTNNIFDFRKLATPFDIIKYEDENIQAEGKDYDLSVKLYDYVYDNWGKLERNYSYEDEAYSTIISGDYSNLERVWFYEWLKENRFDGAYVTETTVMNLFIFNPEKLKIINVEKVYD